MPYCKRDVIFVFVCFLWKNKFGLFVCFFITSWNIFFTASVCGCCSRNEIILFFFDFVLKKKIIKMTFNRDDHHDDDAFRFFSLSFFDIEYSWQAVQKWIKNENQQKKNWAPLFLKRKKKIAPLQDSRHQCVDDCD